MATKRKVSSQKQQERARSIRLAQATELAVSQIATLSCEANQVQHNLQVAIARLHHLKSWGVRKGMDKF
jgi:hypothetical protein